MPACKELAVKGRRVYEKLGTFAMDLGCLTCRGYPEFQNAVQDHLALRAFLRGLRPSHLHEHAMLVAPHSLTKALQEASVLNPSWWNHTAKELSVHQKLSGAK